jgi:hypothetical protein
MAITVSAVVPNYNDASTIGETLEALLTQSHHNIELIVVDDASTDDSVEVIQGFARRDSRVRVIRRAQNGGPVVAQLTGYTAATGKYILGGCSANDKVLPGFLETLVQSLEDSPHAAVALCDMTCPDDARWNLRAGLSDRPVSLTPRRLMDVCRKQMFVLGGGGTLVRRIALQEAGWLVPELRWMADYFAMHVLAFRHGLCYVPETLYSMQIPSYSNSGPRSTAHVDATMALLNLLAAAAYRDVRAAFISSGVLAAVPGILRALALSREHRSLLTPLVLRRCLLQEFKNLVRPVTARGGASPISRRSLNAASSRTTARVS